MKVNGLAYVNTQHQITASRSVSRARVGGRWPYLDTSLLAEA